MADVRAFRALRPAPERAQAVASVPYDVCDTAEARALAAGNADSFLHVTRAEIDMPDGTPPHDGAVYRQGRAALDALRSRGALVQDEAPGLFVYRQVMDGHAQTGVVAAYSVEEYDTGRIVKHEHTRPDKEADRIHHILTVGAQTGPVFLAHRPAPAVKAVVDAATAQAPLFDFVAADGVRHVGWRVPDPAALSAAFAQVDPLYVADGHHRSAAASAVRRQLAAEGPLRPDHPAQRFLAVAFPADELRILPYNRLIHDLGGRTPAELLAELASRFPLAPTQDAAPGAPDAVCVYADGAWSRLTLTPAADTPVGRLAPQMLQDRVLGPLLGISDPRTDARISFVGGIRGTGELARRVDRGEALLAFSLPAVTSEQLFAVADAGLTMPPKSTWFEPKLRSGLFVYPI